MARSKSLVVFVFFILVASVCAIYTLRLFNMQVVHGEVYRRASKVVSTRNTVITAQRGEIFDRNNNAAMVINTDSFAVEIIPGEIPTDYYDTVIAKLADFLSVKKSEIDAMIPANSRRSFNKITIKTNVPFKTISDIAENINDLPGVTWISKPMRNYIETGSFSHILGYVGDITREEYALMYNQGYSRASVVGKTGIERQYDALLQGKDGVEQRTVDVRGRILSEAPKIIPPASGKKLVLTIDTDIQTLAEKALGKRIGAMVVLKPSTGEVLALVSYPYYDSNLFNSENAAAEYAKLTEDERNPLLNRAVNAQYPPASTFKIVMAAAVLNEKAFPSHEKIECKGEVEYGGRVYHCWVLRPGHGPLDLKNALAKSCDIYFWQVGRENLGIQKITQYARLFGYGKSAQIDLPSQSKGFVPSPEWKERRYHERWLGGDTMAVSIGQGYTTATPLQVANVMAMVSNSGTVYKPHLLKEVRDPVSDEVIEEVKPEVLFSSDIEPGIWKEIQDDLRWTVTDGSAKHSLFNKVVKIAAKTGTAEVTGYKDSWHSWLLAYAPWDGPVEDRVVIATIVEAANTWSWWAPYATNITMQGIFAKQTYEEAVEALGWQYLVTRTNQSSNDSRE
ncbi:MAG: penicillin-binding protein 2 [Treponema sp.]|nr:penicillin-binding protein 2 [Treponema sp.]